MSEEKKPKRRDFLFTASYAVGAVGVGAVVWPLIDQMNPDTSVKALATTEVDISNIEKSMSSNSDEQNTSNASVNRLEISAIEPTFLLFNLAPCACAQSSIIKIFLFLINFFILFISTTEPYR